MCIIFTSCFHVCLCTFTHTVGIAGVIHSSEQPLAYSAEKGLASAKAVSNQPTYKREGDMQHQPFASVMQMTEVKQTAYQCRNWQLCRSTDDLPVQGSVTTHTGDYTACTLNKEDGAVHCPPYSKYLQLTKARTPCILHGILAFMLAPTYRPGPLPAKYCQHQ